MMLWKSMAIPSLSDLNLGVSEQETSMPPNPSFRLCDVSWVLLAVWAWVYQMNQNHFHHLTHPSYERGLPTASRNQLALGFCASIDLVGMLAVRSYSKNNRSPDLLGSKSMEESVADPDPDLDLDCCRILARARVIRAGDWSPDKVPVSLIDSMRDQDSCSPWPSVGSLDSS